jgi:hypothetical protein
MSSSSNESESSSLADRGNRRRNGRPLVILPRDGAAIVDDKDFLAVLELPFVLLPRVGVDVAEDEVVVEDRNGDEVGMEVAGNIMDGGDAKSSSDQSDNEDKVRCIRTLPVLVMIVVDDDEEGVGGATEDGNDGDDDDNDGGGGGTDGGIGEPGAVIPLL